MWFTKQVSGETQGKQLVQQHRGVEASHLIPRVCKGHGAYLVLLWQRLHRSLHPHVPHLHPKHANESGAAL